MENFTIKRLAALIAEQCQDISSVFCEYTTCQNSFKKFHVINIVNSKNKRINYNNNFLKDLEVLFKKIIQYDGRICDNANSEDIFGKIWIDFVNGKVSVQVFGNDQELKTYQYLIDPIMKPLIEFNYFLKKAKKNKSLT